MDHETIKLASSRDRGNECSTSGRLIVDKLTVRGLAGSALSDAQLHALNKRLVGLLQEREFKCQQHFDKAFACAWLNGQQVAVGTKCNRLLVLNTDHFQNPHIPLLQEIKMPAAPARPPAPAATEPWSNANVRGQVQNALWTIQAQIAAEHSSGNSSSGSAMEDSDTVTGMIARAIAALDGHYIAPPSPGSFGVGTGGVQIGNCGIHSISVSPCGGLVASGGSDPSDCQIFRVQETADGSVALEASETLVGHRDWLFGSAWVTDRHIVTGSRDMRLKLWCVEPGGTAANCRPLHTQVEESGKVRDVKFMEQQQRVASLAVTGAVHFWDAHLNSIGTVKIPYEREVVCMACSPDVVAVGSQNHFTLVDPRHKRPTTSVANIDHNQGVRSLAFSRSLLSVGSGQGKVNFYDLRAGRYLTAEGLDEQGRRRYCHLQTGTGFLSRNQVYADHFEGMEVRHACYAHAWDASHTKLLAVGGPLAFGLTGCYMGIWE